MHALQPPLQAWWELNAGQKQRNPREERHIAQRNHTSGCCKSGCIENTAWDLVSLQRPIFTEKLSANSKCNMTFPGELLQRGQIHPCFHLLATWAEFGPQHPHEPLISSAPLSRSPLAATPAPLLRGCSREAFLTINHAAEIRFPPDKSPAQSGRKGGESICLIAIDPSFCTPQPLAKRSSGGVSARSARLLPAGVTMEWQNAIPGLAEQLLEPGCKAVLPLTWPQKEHAATSRKVSRLGLEQRCCRPLLSSCLPLHCDNPDNGLEEFSDFLKYH